MTGPESQRKPDPSSLGNSGTVSAIQNCGVGVIPQAFTAEEVAIARSTVLANYHLLKNTRPSPSSRHMASFHRFPGLEPVHTLLTGNAKVVGVLTELLGPALRTIGMSDITINRSQQWHKDLLRGKFSRYIEDENPCANHSGKLFKVILYLQDSASLLVIPGSHRHDIPLDNDDYAIPEESEPISRVETHVGDAVILDICTTHRGSAEDAFSSLEPGDRGRILVSTVIGAVDCRFADQMELGVAVRMCDWQQVNR